MMDDWGIRREVDLGGELRAWREKRKVSLRAMGKILHCDHSRVWKIENNRLPMTREVAELCDTALETGGALVAALSAEQGTIKPAQLPAGPARLVGRDDELAVLTAGVRDQPPGTPVVVAIDGPAGVGKSALALRWAHEVAGRYVDGQLYANLRAFAPGESREQVTVPGILEEFLTAMGASSVPTTIEQRASLFRSLTANRKVLLVLDNVAGIDDIAPLLPASAGCGVVVTSRRALSSLVGQLGATRVTVRPLAEADAIALVSDMIGTSRATAEQAAVTTLTRLCGHLPMALHAAADQISIYPHRRVADLVDELAEDNHRLSVGDTTDLATVFSWSYRDLDPAAARVFRLLGLHHGDSLSVAAVAALAGVTVPLARRLLHSLAGLHLIDIDRHGLVRLPPPIRSYARELVDSEDTDGERSAAAQRLVTWYVHTAHTASRMIIGRTVTPAAQRNEPRLSSSLPHSAPPSELPPVPALDSVHALEFLDRDAALAWCDAEKTNVGPVITLALEYGPAGAAHELATQLESLGLLHRSGSGALPDGGFVSGPEGGPVGRPGGGVGGVLFRGGPDGPRTQDTPARPRERRGHAANERGTNPEDEPGPLTVGQILAAAVATSHHDGHVDGHGNDWCDDRQGDYDGSGDPMGDHPAPPWAWCRRGGAPDGPWRGRMAGPWAGHTGGWHRRWEGHQEFVDLVHTGLRMVQTGLRSNTEDQVPTAARPQQRSDTSSSMSTTADIWIPAPRAQPKEPGDDGASGDHVDPMS